MIHYAERLRESAFLLKGLKIELIDEREEEQEVFYYENGIEAFVEYLNEEKDVFHPVYSLEGTHNDIEVEFAFQFNDGYSENILSFVNNVRTRDGGTHETGAKSAMTRIFNEYARKVGLLKEKDKNLEGTDIREGFPPSFPFEFQKGYYNLKAKQKVNSELLKPALL